MTASKDPELERPAGHAQTMDPAPPSGLSSALDTMRASTEAQVRHDLAAAYRLAALYGWDDTIYTHLSAAVPGEPGVYLINRFGLLFEEVTASSLVKVDLSGRVVDGSGAKVNPSGFAIHGAIHAARSDAACVIHLHSPWGVALSMLPQGLQPYSQGAMRLFRRMGYHPYEGLALGADEQVRIVTALGDRNGLLLANHGPLVLGRTVGEAFMLMYLLERAAQAQLRAMAAAAATRQPLPPVSDAVAETTYRQWVGPAPRDPASEWDGDLEWPALLRRVARLSPGFEM